MSSLARFSRTSAAALYRPVAGVRARHLAAHAAADSAERRYVRLAGLAAYAGREDVVRFMRCNDVDVSRVEAVGRERLVGGSSSGPARLHWVTTKSIADAQAGVAEAADDAPGGVAAEVGPGGAGEGSVEAAAGEGVGDRVADKDADAAGNLVEVKSGEGGGASTGEDADVQEPDGGRADDAGASAGGVLSDAPLLAQGTYDVFMNHSIWLYDAGSGEAAREAAAKLTGKTCGMKLVRAAAVDGRIGREIVATPESEAIAAGRKGGGKGGAAGGGRARMRKLAPLAAERDRALLLVGLSPLLRPRFLWSFFGGYDVQSIRHLRRDRMAAVVFRRPEEADRAHRERANLPLHMTPKMLIRRLN